MYSWSRIAKKGEGEKAYTNGKHHRMYCCVSKAVGRIFVKFLKENGYCKSIGGGYMIQLVRLAEDLNGTVLALSRVWRIRVSVTKNSGSGADWRFYTVSSITTF